MRGGATRHARRRVAVDRIGRMFGTVIGNDWRTIVVGAEVETGAGILLDVDLVGETADFPPRFCASRSRLLDFIGHRATAANFSLGVRHRESRPLAGDRPTLRLVGVEKYACAGLNFGT